ncbi:MAG: ribonucleoside triphosphate reductase, partial [Clostridia bacterium]|nr:ribonucleoside triphosphate reductase [Clostridia bacterium]
NDGKAQEFKDRKVNNIGRSTLRHVGPNPAPNDEVLSSTMDAALEAAAEPACCAPTEPVIAPEEPKDSVTVMLFKTPTCPNCKLAGALLDKAGVRYIALNANEEKDLVEKYGIKQAPTLVLVDGDEFEKYRGVSDIKGWLMHKGA